MAKRRSGRDKMKKVPNLENPKGLFDWFTKEVVNSDEVYYGNIGNDVNPSEVLATSLVKVKSFELAKRRNLGIEFEHRVDGRKYVDVVFRDKKGKILLAIESESSPGVGTKGDITKNWEEKIRPSLQKLGSFEGDILRFGIYYVAESKTKVGSERNARKLCDKIKKEIGKKPRGEWLLVIGAATSDESWFHGFVFKNGGWYTLPPKKLPEKNSMLIKW